MKVKQYEITYPDSQLYYTLNKVLTFDADVYLIQSIRNLGKSFSARDLVKNTMNKGYNCAWLRWDKTETATALNKFQSEKELVSGLVKDSNVGYVVNDKNDSKTYFLSVKLAMSYKDFGIDNLRYVVYDECVPEHYDVKTRRETEFKKLMSLFNTIKRDSKTRLIMICNCIDWFNPFTSAWGIYPFNSGIVKVFTKEMLINDKTYKMRILMENVKPSPAMVNRVAQLEVLRGNAKSVNDYFKNQTSIQYNLLDVCPDLNTKLADIQIRVKEDYYTYRKYNGLLYFVKSGYRDGIDTDNADIHDMRPNEYRTKEIGKQLEDMFNRGILRFDSGHTFNAIISCVYKYREHL